mmetsp:Transcript_30472/g.26992  ORF Transcript_30472/g.26992 Transcript_30472/m.26992 type:complete len:99 (+) Transcript_30472:3-299(+)
MKKKSMIWLNNEVAIKKVKINNIERFCINPHKFRSYLSNKPKKTEINYKLTKFGTEKGTFHSELGNTHSTWLGETNISTTINKNSDESNYEKLTQGIP